MKGTNSPITSTNKEEGNGLVDGHALNAGCNEPLSATGGAVACQVDSRNRLQAGYGEGDPWIIASSIKYGSFK